MPGREPQLRSPGGTSTTEAHRCIQPSDAAEPRHDAFVHTHQPRHQRAPGAPRRRLHGRAGGRRDAALPQHRAVRLQAPQLPSHRRQGDDRRHLRGLRQRPLLRLPQAARVQPEDLQQGRLHLLSANRHRPGSAGTTWAPPRTSASGPSGSATTRMARTWPATGPPRRERMVVYWMRRWYRETSYGGAALAADQGP